MTHTRWEVRETMQRHEGPQRDREAEERRQQWSLTRRLLLVILLLSGSLAAMLYDRWT